MEGNNNRQLAQELMSANEPITIPDTNLTVSSNEAPNGLAVQPKPKTEPLAIISLVTAILSIALFFTGGMFLARIGFVMVGLGLSSATISVAITVIRNMHFIMIPIGLIASIMALVRIKRSMRPGKGVAQVGFFIHILLATDILFAIVRLILSTQ